MPALLRLYVDIEFTGGNNQFYDKFNIRYQIGEILEYAWKVEPHRRAWAQLALADSPFYTRFLNMAGRWMGGACTARNKPLIAGVCV